MQRLYDRCPVRISKPKMSDPHTKANVLLQSHFSRYQLPADLQSDLAELVLKRIIPLIYATVDVLSSNGWLTPALAAMELSQMIVQAMWGDRESPLRQLPHFDQPRVQSAKQMGVETVFDLLEIEDDKRTELLADLSAEQVAEIAQVANRYPNVDVSYQLSTDGDNGDANECAMADEGGNQIISCAVNQSVFIDIQLTREEEEEEENDKDNNERQPIGPVHAPFFPTAKDEGWWLVVANPETKQLLSIKRLTLQHAYKCRLDFVADQAGRFRYKLYLMSDCWVGCDQEYEFEAVVSEAMDEQQ
jgi:pre-mRNA-splicing helicase BRR2